MNDSEENVIKNLQVDPTANVTPLTETYDLLMMSDSTSVIEVIQFVGKHDLVDGTDILDHIENFVGMPVPREESEKGDLIQAGLALLSEYNSEINRAENGVDAVLSKHVIRRGQILLKLKQLVKKAGQSWDVWATIHVPYLSQRTRIDNMRLASRTDCHGYYFLGSERLLMLVRATEGHKVADPIGEFLKKHGITFDPQSSKIKEFKLAVDAALNADRLEKVGVTADVQTIKTLTQYIPCMDNNLILTAKAIADSNGDVNHHFEKLILNKGKEKNPFDGHKAVKDFNTSGKMMIQIINYMISNEDTIETLDTEVITELEKKLTELKKLANIQ